jgi:hypothetical protein
LVAGIPGLKSETWGTLRLFPTQISSRTSRARLLSRPARERLFVAKDRQGIVTGILSGLIPALSMTKADVSNALKQGLGRTDADSGGGNTRSALVVIEVALSVVLLTGAGLMIRSLWKLQTIDPGFDQRNVLTLAVMVPKHQFTDPTQESHFFDEVLQRVRSLPGVESAGAVDDLPLVGGSNEPIAAEGHPLVAMSDGGECGCSLLRIDVRYRTLPPCRSCSTTRSYV